MFGLPLKVENCKNCLMTNQKPYSMNETKNFKGSKKNGLKINRDGLCEACKYAQKKNMDIDWDEREKKLLETLSKYRSKNGNYDCIVSGSGGKDSSTQAHLLKYKYNMNPLTVTYSPILYTNVGWRNMQSWIKKGGFDNYLFSPNGKVLSTLSLEAFKNFLHPIQPFKFGIKSFATKLACKFNINLIIYGEPYSEYGSESTNSSDKPKYNIEWLINDKPLDDVFISGTKISDLKRKYQWMTDVDFFPYKPLTSKEIKDHNINIEYLGWYLKWDPQSNYYYASENCGYEPDEQRTDGTYGRYAAIDDKFEWLHYYCHYIKFGIGRCRFDASQEIRAGHITREEGIKLCKKYEGEFPKRYFKDCIDFMGITEKEAHQIIDNFRPKHLWLKKNMKWIRKQEILNS